ncbi:MAG: GCN5-related N-acetyltransferase [Firmicutes bacterium]|nr:GCN5-related N-acetyltransferase [Bacillota bacterium]
MIYEIKELSPELTRDYLDFFDNRAFSDGNPNGPCYCTSPTMDRETEEKMVSEFGDDVKGTLRRYAMEMLNNGMIHGYLAFDRDIPIGWCNAADMDSFKAFVPDFARDNQCGKTFSVVCFEVAPGYRGKGLATEFLKHICTEAKAQGYVAVEGYARLSIDPEYLDFNGSIGLYERAGFTEVKRNEEQVIMRKRL